MKTVGKDEGKEGSRGQARKTLQATEKNMGFVHNAKGSLWKVFTDDVK